MKKKAKTLLLSTLALCMSVSLVAGGTYALFTDSVEVNTHLAAGNLDVGLYRTSYKEYVLDAKGLMAEGKEDTTKVDLTDDANSLFSVTEAVPTSWYQATIEVSNIGSTAFDYGMRILWEPTKKKSDKDDIFASQIEITVTSANLDQAVVFMLEDCKQNDVELGSILKGEAAESFTVKAVFIDDDNVNNSAMRATIDFDVQVYASQKTA